MKNRGFTLIELLGVIIILALLVTIAFPSIINSIKGSGRKTDNLMLDMIYNAADLYVSNNPNEYGKVEGNKYIVSLSDLVSEDLLASPIKFSDSEEDITNLKCVQVYYLNGSFSYELKNNAECVFSGSIYRNTEDVLYIGESIVPHDKDVWCAIYSSGGNSCTPNVNVAPFGYLTESDCLNNYDISTCEEGTISVGLTLDNYYTERTKSNIDTNMYLKHDIVNNIVTASYACIRYGTNKEACVKGADINAYGSFDGMTNEMSSVSIVTNPTGNVAEIAKTRDYFLENGGSCSFDYDSSVCGDSVLNLSIEKDSGVFAWNNNNNDCFVDKSGSSACEYP